MMYQKLAKLPKNANVGVVGGGLSGLFFSYFLGQLRPDVKITLMEQNREKMGGWINSWETVDKQNHPVMIERGPRTLRGVSDGTVLIVDNLLQLGQSDRIKYVEKNSPADRKYLLDNDDTLIQVPDSFETFLKFSRNSLSKGLFGGMLFEWMRKSVTSMKDESVESLVNRRYGNDFISNNIMSAIYRGIYADDISTLSAEKVSKKLFYDERKYGSSTRASLVKWWGNRGKHETPVLSEVLQAYQSKFKRDPVKLIKLSEKLKQYPMLGFVGGLSTVPNTIRDALCGMNNVSIVREKTTRAYLTDNKTVNIELNDDGNNETAFDHVRFSMTPNYINDIIKRDNQSLSTILNEVKYNTVLLVNYYLSGKDVIDREKHGFGYLVPKSNKNPEKLLGVIFDSVIERNLKPFDEFPGETEISGNTKTGNSGMDKTMEYTKLTAMLGGYLLNNSNGIAEIPDRDTVIQHVKQALYRHLKVSEKDLESGLWQYTVAQDCLPRFSVGYNEWVKKVEDEFISDYKGKISLGGMGFSRGPGVPDVVTDSLMDAIKLA